MATKYLRIVELQPPFDLGVLDENQRACWSFNITATKEPSGTFEKELVAILVAASVVVYVEEGGGANNVFMSAKASIPKAEGPYLQILASGGVSGSRIQNSLRPVIEYPSAQITVRAKSAAAAEAMTRAAYAALLDIRNVTITPVA